MDRRRITAGLLAMPLASLALTQPARAGARPVHTDIPDPKEASRAASPARDSDWREIYAYSLGVQAFVFGFPWLYLPTLRWSWTNVPKPAGSIAPYAPLNHFFNVRKLADATYRDGGCPNNDTLYSIAWVDVRNEPLILSHPDMGERYFTFEMASLDSDNFAYVGTRTTGSKAGHFAIVGPDWSGDLPQGVQRLEPSRTVSALILGRTLVDGPNDVPNVTRLQDQYRLTPLSLWGKPGAVAPDRRDVFKPFDAKADPLADWKTINLAMTQDPPNERHVATVKTFAQIGVGPHCDVEAMDPDTKRGLARAAAEGRRLLNDVIRSGDLGYRVNGWSIPPIAMGRAGLHDDFLLRASLQCLGGIIANDPAEALYLNTTVDGKNEPLDGSKRYVLHFLKGQLPDVKAFWSVTMYDQTYNLVANPIHRYSIGNRTGGLKSDPDGGLTIYLQASAPDGDKQSNWLPSPASGGYLLVLRTYLPSPNIIERRWQPPGIEVVS